jgi:hypothetical protein
MRVLWLGATLGGGLATYVFTLWLLGVRPSDFQRKRST